MKFFLDQGVPHRSAPLLREAGVNALHASEIGLSSADDTEILNWCLANDAVAVTLDADFHRTHRGNPFLDLELAPMLNRGIPRIAAPRDRDSGVLRFAFTVRELSARKSATSKPRSSRTAC